MGEFVAWVIGWDLILEYALGATTVAVGWSGYVVSLLEDLGILLPNEFAGSPFAYDAATHMWLLWLGHHYQRPRRRGPSHLLLSHAGEWQLHQWPCILPR
jgi:amino acid transporter